MAVPVQIGATFSHGNPKKLFDWPSIAAPGLGRTYDVSADGQRFLMIKEGSAGDTAFNSAGASLVVVLNWTEELKRLLPVK